MLTFIKLIGFKGKGRVYKSLSLFIFSVLLTIKNCLGNLPQNNGAL